MSKVIGDYTAAVTIDGSTHYLLIQPGSSSTQYNKINRNVLLGVTGQPADISTAQNLTNKTLDNTNTVTVKDTLFTLQDDGDTTKQARFQLSGITTATTRTYTLPNASSTIADISTAQTFTNKTLTSPTITGGSVTNATISVDSIAEFTAANGVTVDGLNIKDGKLNTNNSVVTSNITDGATTPAKLQSGTGAGWSWQTWTPTLVNLSGGTITTAKYIQTGKTVQFIFVYTLAGAGVTGAPTFTLPVTASASAFTSFENNIGGTLFVDAGTAVYYGPCWLSSTTIGAMYVWNAGSTYLVPTAISSTVPFTFGNTDKIICTGTYEAA